MRRKVIPYELQFKKKFSWKRMKYLWRWTIVATNGNIMDTSTQGYVNISDAEYNAKSVALSISQAFDSIVEHQ